MKSSYTKVSLFLAFLLLGIGIQIAYVFTSFLFGVSYGGGTFGSFLFYTCALWYYSLCIILGFLFYKIDWKTKSAFFIAGIPMLIVFVFNMFIGFSHKSHLQVKGKITEYSYSELPANVQQFFTEWEGKEITTNKVVSSGHHPLGHQHFYYSDGFAKLMVEGKPHSFYMSGKKFILPFFVKNAFYLLGDVLYYSSDFLNWRSAENATYYGVDLKEYYHPKGSAIPHEFTQQLFDNNQDAYGRSNTLRYPIKKDFD